MSPEVERMRVSPFRRRRFAARRRRPSPWPTLVKGFLGALVVVGVPVSAGIWALTSPRFLVHELEVEGTPHVSEAWVEASLTPYLGHNLLLVPLSDAGDVVRTHPWVERVELRKTSRGRQCGSIIGRR